MVLNTHICKNDISRYTQITAFVLLIVVEKGYCSGLICNFNFQRYAQLIFLSI